MRPARAALQPAMGCPHVGVDVTGQDGVVTALELFDARGETIAMLFGARKPGEPERPAWLDLMRRLPGKRSACLPLGCAMAGSA